MKSINIIQSTPEQKLVIIFTEITVLCETCFFFLRRNKYRKRKHTHRIDNKFLITILDWLLAKTMRALHFIDNDSIK